ncbi:carbohydrate binding domain-containing protein [Chitinispirillales bacterium ANBcel5]|uniref:carbohydrate binding domain-containing protein n=1 Tax=Cellulosispirillum alkaliphilum TaxID=3039283 RepID=UPI002A536050|nr:carbohydrate binding domain-containing protein [Chitinispirillales bacterium ANBcel5]
MKVKILFSLALLIYPVIIVAQTNLLTNGGFENEMENWTHLVAGDGEATFSLETTDVQSGANALNVEVERAGTDAWDIQSIHSGWASVQGQEYTLTFYGKSPTGSSLRMVQQNSTYSSRDFALSNSWEEHSWTFTAQEDDLQLKIHFFESGTFLVDEFVISGEDNAGGAIPITIDPSSRYQEMVGFGGALTWHSDRITRSPHKEELFTLLFEELGMDVLRLKNWYYPQDYPTSKSSQTMEVDWFRPHFVAAQELFEEAKSRNPEIEVLLSSWGPPSSLKSNDDLSEGTLKKDDSGNFMYSEFAQYWVDVLDSIGFTPDYISIQNEPGFTTENWTTCAWRPTETSEFPGFDIALDSVYGRISGRSDVPKIIAPETENIGQAIWDNSINTFSSMNEPLSTKDYIDAYGYHIYNFYNGPGTIDADLLNMIRDDFGNKPNWMTEFSSTNYDWLATAHTIQQNLLEANTSAYIYWELMWDEESDQAMIAVDTDGNYQVQSHYYTIKHFSKYIHQGYHRIASSGATGQLSASSFISPDETSITTVLVNRSPLSQELTLSHAGVGVKSVKGYQSVEDQWFTSLSGIDLGEDLVVPGQSLTTLVVELGDTTVSVVPRNSGVRRTSVSPSNEEWSLFSIRGELVRRGTGQNINFNNLATGLYWLRVGREKPRAVRINLDRNVIEVGNKKIKVR